MGSVEIPKWLERLPLAPEFCPTDTEFADPIAYISKIEKEASAFGICKVIPPLPKPSKRYVFHNLNKSLSKCPELGNNVDVSGVSSLLRSSLGDGANDGEFRAVFTTRHQELGQGLRRMKGVDKESPHLGVCKQVWQSGEIYTLEQFESKSKAFAKSMLGMFKEVNPLVIEALFWKAASEKPICVEYANDVPGSAFGEPEGQFRYFRRQRRKRASYQSYRKNRESSDNEQNKMEGLKYSQDHEVKVASVDHDTTPTSEKNPRSPTNSSTSLPEEIVRPTKKRSTSAGTDMEGTAGWKLSNSPWNLQVIARSPGSLTRFMPDDIPGVTSPMIYIGMLFSWFAWHVEDHELHSMNFLHTGSPKTWYSVPGEYAQTFEEVIRTDAYGGNVDRLAALTLLGEKTTLLSPEVMVSSNIPCCRLIQNPGEFVVTFPRAYHVGFSHGFNCGEAANFGTPQWLEVAKEAAVRRAAMNYLPMLSHQQLLYLLTMSFVSRVPRELLPGVRWSRLRDRQREDRELLVKKAFLEDMLKENSILSALLGRNSAFHAVEWNPELLPCTTRDKAMQLPGVAADNDTTQTEIHDSPNCDNYSEKSDLFKEMSLYMENLNDLYAYDDDLSCDFQIDSGTLACVACGILGFPFMCVIQPSEAASIELWSKEEAGTSRLGNDHADACGLINVSVSDDGRSLPHFSPPSKDIPTLNGWSTSCKFLRPRIFCMEHGIQIKKLFRSKGGTNMLIICHSDYQKIKAHAAAIAEEIGVSYDYHEVPIESASQEELNLIDLAIDSEDHSECGDDWTSVVGINLQHCVRTRKHSPSKRVQHALELGGLFSEKNILSDLSSMKWQSRRSRSKIKLNQPAESKPYENNKTNKDALLLEEPDVATVGKEKRLIQYTRRKSKMKIDSANSVSQGEPKKLLVKQILHASCDDVHKPTGKSPVVKTPVNEIGACGCADLDLPSVGVSKVLHEVQALDASDSTSFEAVGSLFTTTSGPNAMEQIDYMNLEEPVKKSNNEDNASNASAFNSSEVSHQIKDFGSNSEDEISRATKCSSLFVSSTNGGSAVQKESQTTETIFKIESHNTVSERQLGSSGDVLTHMAIADQQTLHLAIRRKVENAPLLEESYRTTDACQPDIDLGQGLQTSKSSDARHILCNKKLINQSTTTEESCGLLEISPKESSFIQEDATGIENIGKLIVGDLELISQAFPGFAEETSGVSVESCAPTNSCCAATAENDAHQEFQNLKGNEDNIILHSPIQGEANEPNASGKESKIPIAMSAGGDLCLPSTSDEVQLQILTADKSSKEKLVPDSTVQDQPLPVSVDCTEVRRDNDATEDMSGTVTSDTETERRIQSSDGLGTNEMLADQTETNEELVLGLVLQTNEPATSLSQSHSRAEETCADGKSLGVEEVQSLNQSSVLDPRSTSGKGKKRKNEAGQISEYKLNCSGFIRSPCEGLRPRAVKTSNGGGVDVKESLHKNLLAKRPKKTSDQSLPPERKEVKKKPHKCDLEGCRMSFHTKTELLLHKRNRCPHEGCKKRFSTHKYAMIHQRVHEDDRPLKCPWKGCSMTFKWAWARTEHIRVHTGEKPYQCKVEGCGHSFRFVSDFSRHRRRTGHYVDMPASP